MAEPVCVHCHTGLHPDPAWRNLLSRAALRKYDVLQDATDVGPERFVIIDSVYLHSNCIAEYLQENPRIALSTPT